MLIFGYIINNRKDSSIQEDIVKQVLSLDECQINVPKLIVGLEKAKQYAYRCGFEFDILNHHYPNGDMWTFAKTEKRQFYESDIESFKIYIKKYIFNNINYIYINIFNLNYNNIKKLYNLIINNSFNRRYNYIVIDKGMLYYPIENNTVIGLSLANLEYLGIKREKVIKRIESNIYNRIYYTSSKNMWQLKKQFDGKEYVIASIFENNAFKEIS